MRVVQALTEMFARIGIEWVTIKQAIEQTVAFAPETLHVVVGVVIQLVAAAVFRTSIARPLPWLVVLALELSNEATDFWVEVWSNRTEQAAGGVNDVVLTMFLPTVLVFVARCYPSLLGKQGKNPVVGTGDPSSLL